MLAPKKAKYRKWQTGRRRGARLVKPETRGITLAFGQFGLKAFTQKAAEVGMGSGKGDVAGYVFEVRPGRILFEIDGAPEQQAREALRKAGTKLPLKARVVARA